MGRTAPYGTWLSPLAPERAAAGAVRFGGVAVDGEDVLWVAARPTEGGRNVLLRRRADGQVEEVTSPAFNVRTRVHEYGGGAFVADGGDVVFSNDADGRLYLVTAGSAPRALVPPGPRRYADLVFDRAHRRILCVLEQHGAAGEPRNLLAAVPLGPGESEPRPLVSGADFYAFPRPSPDGTQLAFLCWDHPRMPWQSAALFVAPLGPEGVGPAEKVAGGLDEAVFQPAWSPAGVLHFVSDRTGFWNLYRWRDGAAEALWPVEAEVGAPLWVFGLSTYAFVDEQTIVCAHQQQGTWRLALLHTRTRSVEPVSGPSTEIGYVNAGAGGVVFVGASPTEPPALWRVAAGTRAATVFAGQTPLVLDADYVSHPRPVTFPTAGGALAHALYYPPRNPDFEAPAEERPPLVVMSHGGPTAAASTALNLALQFWTSRGFAVLDVNYRGSSGYGRAYRQALDGLWGIADVDDCVAGARHLAELGLVDPKRLLIRGGSAGGYTTLAALTFRDAFRAGASYYGVSDLAALVRETHKFESRYLDSLVGPYPARAELYRERSPLFFPERLSCPVIFFQGLEDKVVPPEQAEAMVVALRRKGVPVEYVTFPDEQHGFRRAENVARALAAELAFYARVLALDLPDR